MSESQSLGSQDLSQSSISSFILEDSYTDSDNTWIPSQESWSISQSSISDFSYPSQDLKLK